MTRRRALQFVYAGALALGASIVLFAILALRIVMAAADTLVAVLGVPS